VSPLIKIHNETGFSMELQFQRPAPTDDEFASVLLKPGDSIDDSMAIFDAINFSGGVKRALMSLSVGIHFHLLIHLLTAIHFNFALILFILYYSCAPLSDLEVILFHIFVVYFVKHEGSC
jgi:hypothetical protein